MCALGWIVAAACAFPTAAAASGTGSSPWLQSGYNAAHSEFNAAETAVTSANVARLRPAMRIAGSGKAGECAAGVTLTVLSDARVYVLDRGRLAAYTVGTHRQLWSTVVDPYADIAPVGLAVSHGQVLLGQDDCFTTDPTGSISVYASDTGHHLQTVFGPSDSLFDFVVAGRYLVANWGCAECSQYQDIRVYDLPADRVVGRHGASSADVRTTAVVGGSTFETVQAANGASRLNAYRVSSGQLTWSRAGGDTVIAGDSPSPDARTLVVAQPTGALDVLDPATGRLRYHLTGVVAGAAIAVGGARIYAGCGAHDEAVCAFSASSGQQVWRVAGADGGGIVAAGDVVYLADGRVLSAADGHQLSRLPGDPVAVGNVGVGVLEPSPHPVDGDDLVLFRPASASGSRRS